MTFDEYQQAALRTADSDKPGDLKLAILALGLCGEVSELASIVDAKGSPEEIQKELGDVLWYSAVLAHTVGLAMSDLGAIVYSAPVPSIFGTHADMFDASTFAGRIAELVKKQVGHNKPIKNSDMIYCLRALLHAARGAVDVSLEQVAMQNIEKLNNRYPNGFKV